MGQDTPGQRGGVSSPDAEQESDDRSTRPSWLTCPSVRQGCPDPAARREPEPAPQWSGAGGRGAGRPPGTLPRHGHTCLRLSTSPLRSEPAQEWNADLKEIGKLLDSGCNSFNQRNMILSPSWDFLSFPELGVARVHRGRTSRSPFSDRRLLRQAGDTFSASSAPHAQQPREEDVHVSESRRKSARCVTSPGRAERAACGRGTRGTLGSTAVGRGAVPRAARLPLPAESSPTAFQIALS